MLSRMHVKVLLLCIALAAAAAGFCSAKDLPETVIVETKYGKVEGDVIKVPGEDFVAAAFKGIRFGIAKLFQKPEPVKPWKDVLQARQWGNRCLQHQAFGQTEPLFANDTSEDCLFINVFGPYEKEGKLRPVMVFIYGGGLAVGSSNEYGQEGVINWMVPKGIVMVTFNYRVGPWGFFSTGDSNAPGNYGFWDQTLALQWVKDNIDRFGGDPNKVTVFGESAGAISTSFLALSPHSRDLFHQSIAMSGSSYLPWFGEEDGHTLEVSDLLSKALGCGPVIKSDTVAVDTKRVVECIKSKPTLEILEKLHTYRPFGKFEFYGFVARHDGDFFPESLEKLQEKAPPKPLISGTTEDEMGCFVTPPYHMDNEWDLKDPDSFSYDELLEKLDILFPEKTYKQWTPLIRQLALHHYVDAHGDRRNNTFLVEQYKQLFSDFLFGYPAYVEALQRYKKGSKVWFYLFDYYDNAMFPPDHKFRGAPHFLELPYLFRMEQKMYHPSSFDEGDDKKIKDIMTTLWTNFAKYGHPNPPESPLHKEFAWEPISDAHPERYLHIGLQTQQREQYNRRMVSFWYELLPKVLTFLKQSTSMGQAKPSKSEL